MTTSLVHLVETGGLIAIFLAMILESMGIPISVEVVAPVGGALAAAGKFSLVEVIVAVVAGNLIGSFIAYWLAFRYGRRLVLGPGHYIGLSEGHLQLADRFFARFGACGGARRPGAARDLWVHLVSGRPRPDARGLVRHHDADRSHRLGYRPGGRRLQARRELADVRQRPGCAHHPLRPVLVALIVVAYVLGRRWVHKQTAVPVAARDDAK